VFGDSTCPGTIADPKLGPLQDNGGLTATMALLPGSHAIDGVPVGADCPLVDQRGIMRPFGGTCDIGAYEWAPPSLANVTATAAGANTAVVNATVNPNAQATALTVHYGPTLSYGSTTNMVDEGSGATPVAAGLQLGGLMAGTTYHAQLIATNDDGTSTSADLTFTTPRTPSGSSGRPVISALRQSSSRWRRGNRLPQTSVKRTPGTGTTFSFILNERATVKFAFVQSQPGRTVNRSCAPTNRFNIGRRKCSRSVTKGTLALAARAGTNKVHFEGRVTRLHTLQLGTYTVVVTATNAAHQRSAPRRLRFTIVR
jgi:hypothetical protein